MPGGPPGEFPQAGKQGPSSGNISQADLQRMCSQGRWSGLSQNLRRAAADIYMTVRQGNTDVREWFLRIFGANGDHSLWHTACAVDLRIEELLKHGPQGLA